VAIDFDQAAPDEPRAMAQPFHGREHLLRRSFDAALRLDLADGVDYGVEGQ
jgi:hypothetical protein